MPRYKRYRKKSKKSFRRRRFRKSRMSRAMRKFMRPELKFFQAEASVTPSSTWVWTPLFFPAQGTTGVTRLGNKLLIRKIEMRANVVGNAAAVVSFCRVMLLFVRLPNAGDITPNVSDILDNPTYSQNAFYSKTTIAPYNIIMDRMFTLQVADSKNQGKITYRKRKPFPVVFVTNAGSVADVVKNALYIGYWSNQATNTPTLYYTYRVLFTDV